MKKMFLAGFVMNLIFSLLLLGCGTSDDGKGKAGEPCNDDGTCDTGLLCMSSGVCKAQVTLTEFAAEAASLNCHWLFACCSEGELTQISDAMGLTDQLKDEASCSSFFKSALESGYSTPAQNAIDAGRGEYFPDKAAACLAVGTQTECSGNGSDALKSLLKTCDDSYNGLQANGDDCSSQVECSAGLLCVNGKCLQPKAQGDNCTDGDPHLCGEGLYCNDPDGTGGSCEARKPKDADCSNIKLECASGLKCDTETSKCVAIEAICTGGE